MSSFSYDEKTIMDLEDRRFAAMKSNDADALGDYLDERVTYIHSSAVRDGKQAYLDAMREGQLVYHEFRRDYSDIVPLTEDSFLVTGRIGIDLTLGGKAASLDNLFVAVWVRREDQKWRLASWQSTPFPKPAA